MKILSIRQPWAGAIMRGKNVENRSWYTRQRGTIGIHSAQKIDREAFGRYGNLDLQSLIEAERSTGVILGIVNLVDVHQDGDDHCRISGCFTGEWSQHTTDPYRPVWHWQFSHPREFVTPIRAKGALGFWEPNDSVVFLMQLAEFTDGR